MALLFRAVDVMSAVLDHRTPADFALPGARELPYFVGFDPLFSPDLHGLVVMLPAAIFLIRLLGCKSRTARAVVHTSPLLKFFFLSEDSKDNRPSVDLFCVSLRTNISPEGLKYSIIIKAFWGWVFWGFYGLGLTSH